MLARRHPEAYAGKVASPDVVHIVDAEPHVAFGAEQARIALGGIDIVVDIGYVDSTQAVGEGGRGDVEEGV